MADKKISALTSLAQGDVAASTDVLPIVDTSATETKKITASALVGAGMTAGVTNVDINSGAIDGTTIGANSAAAGTFTTLTGTTKVVSPYVDAVGSAGGQLRNASGTSQLAWGAGGGSNLSLEVATNINPANAAVSIAPTGTGTVTINPATAGTMNNVAIGGTTAAAGSFTTLTTSSTVTLNGGTANSVLYLNGSKVATSGSALTFNGTSFGVGSSNYGNAGTITAAIGVAGTTAGGLQLWSPTNGEHYVQFGDGTSAADNYRGAVGYNHTSDALLFLASSAEAMRLTSSTLYTASGINVGIGTSSLQSGTRLTLQESASNPSALAIRNRNSTQTWQISVDAAAVDDKILAFIDPGAGVVRMALDSSGNLGLGVSPSAWGSTFRALQMTGAASIAGTTDPSLQVSQNAYYNGTNWIYSTTGAASNYNQAGGVHAWRIAASGTAGNTISFTQAMTLDASGNLAVGTTTALGTNAGRGNITINGASEAILSFGDAGVLSAYLLYDGLDFWINNTGSGSQRFYTGGSERARITAAGEFLVGTTSADNTAATGGRLYGNGSIASTRSGTDNTTETLVVYSTGAAANRFYVGMGGTVYATNTTISAISDQRFKENVSDLDVGLDAVLALKPRKFDWKEGKGKDIKGDRGFIAQEFEQVFPDLVDEWRDPAPEGEKPYKSVRQDLIPVLVKAIQEQQAMIKSLEAKVAALESK